MKYLKNVINKIKQKKWVKRLFAQTRKILKNPLLVQNVINLLQTVIAVVIALFIGGLLISFSDRDPFSALFALFTGSFGSIPAILRTLRMATPLILTGSAVVVAFRAGFIYLGMEGSLYWGALCSALFAIYLAPSLPVMFHLPLSLVVGFIAGGLWAFIPAFLRAKWRVDEVVSTLMLNYVALLLVDQLVYSFFQDPVDGTQAERALTYRVPPSARLPFLNERFGLTLGIFISLAVVVLLFWIFKRTTVGYELDMTGYNRRFSRYGGIKILKMALLSMVISGALSGLGGAVEIVGTFGRYIGGFSSDLGFDGITVALMGRLHPLGVIISALFVAGIKTGGSAMELSVGVPRDLVVVVQGLIMLFVTAQALFYLLRLKPKRNTVE